MLNSVQRDIVRGIALSCYAKNLTIEEACQLIAEIYKSHELAEAFIEGMAAGIFVVARQVKANLPKE